MSQQLADRIEKFLDKYAQKNPNYADENDNLYTSPDADILRYAMMSLRCKNPIDHCWSEWGSGGYVPYTSKEGRLEHDEIVKEINKLISK